MRDKIIYIFFVAMILLSIPSNKVFAAEDKFVNNKQTEMSSSIQSREILTYQKKAMTEDNKVRVEATITVQGSSMTIIGIKNAYCEAWDSECRNIAVGAATIRNNGAFATVAVIYEDGTGKIHTTLAYIYP